MKYYSDQTKQLYETENALITAEKAFAEAQKKEEEKKQERTARAKEIEDAFKAANDARLHAQELLNAFTKDYGSFHMTFKDKVTFPFFFDPFF